MGHWYSGSSLIFLHKSSAFEPCFWYVRVFVNAFKLSFLFFVHVSVVICILVFPWYSLAAYGCGLR